MNQQAIQKMIKEEKAKRDFEREVSSIKVFVKVKIRQVTRGTSLFRIAQITKI